MKTLRKNPQPKPICWDLKSYKQRRNHILILREVGGLGDILMQRMMFEGFKRVMPDAHITWAVPNQYIDAAVRHPFVDDVVDCQTVDKEQFNVIYNITYTCGRYESRIAPNADKNRSDIWSEHCGVILTRHNMHLNPPQDEKDAALFLLKSKVKYPDRPILAFCPISAQVGKNLSNAVMSEVVLRIESKGCNVIGFHSKQIEALYNIKCPVLSNMTIREWIAALSVSDYVVAVDTSAFHCAGGLQRPLTGIFTYCDGKIYGEHYKFELVQKHRDDGNWDCGPCFNWCDCTKDKGNLPIKPCAKEITADMVMDGVERMMLRWKNE